MLCFGSGSGLDPHSDGSEDPNPNKVSKKPVDRVVLKKEENVKKLMFELLNVLYGGHEACPELRNPSRRSHFQLFMLIFFVFFN
jgi:hypothetical protein